jgi:hypothetical protein
MKATKIAVAVEEKKDLEHGIGHGGGIAAPALQRTRIDYSPTSSHIEFAGEDLLEARRSDIFMSSSTKLSFQGTV